jgi:hypothetical protein
VLHREGVGYFEVVSLERSSKTCHAESMARKTPAKQTAKKPKTPRDMNQLAHQLVRESREPHEVESPVNATPLEISRVMSEMGRRGGRIGGKKRAASLSPEKRREIALKAARCRWDGTSRG